jgi:interferon gamma-inducible protein 30
MILPAVQGVEKVKVELYSESLCPYCANFIINYLNPFFNNGLIDVVELRIIPYGNAHIHADGSLTCQHGQDECYLNIIQTCAIRLWPKVTDWFPFIYCLEKLPRATAAQDWKSCVEPSRLDLAPLLECSASPLGEKLELEFAAETDRLQPPHKYVPWVLVNGEPLYENYEDVAIYVCKDYQGTKPAVCSRLLPSESLKMKQSADACYKTESF